MDAHTDPEPVAERLAPPQKVTIPMSGLARGMTHNVTVALVGLSGLVLASDSLLFQLQ